MSSRRRENQRWLPPPGKRSKERAAKASDRSRYAPQDLSRFRPRRRRWRRRFLRSRRLPIRRRRSPHPARRPTLPARWAPGEDRFIRPDVGAGDRPVGASFASRTAVYGTSGAAGTAHPLATMAGIDILKRGGSAVDAAIAINACLGFLEPTANGIGGDCYVMLWDPKERKVMGLAGSGKSPRGLEPRDGVRSRAKNGVLPPYGAVTVSVPGAVDAWWMLHQRYGKLKWAEVLAPAIDLAENGAPVPDLIAWSIRRSHCQFRAAMPGRSRRSTTRSRPGRPEARRRKREASSATPIWRGPLRLIAEGGRDAFYAGPIARTIDAYFKRIGGWLRYEDLAAHRGEWIEPHMTDLSRRRRPCARRQYPGHRDAADAQHPREFRPAAPPASSRRSRSIFRPKPSASPMRIARATTPIRTSPTCRSSG